MKSDEILTDEKGRPFARPAREEFASDLEFMRAFYAFKDRVAACANETFAETFRKSVRA